jgi:hypothetical protein
MLFKLYPGTTINSNFQFSTNLSSRIFEFEGSNLTFQKSVSSDNTVFSNSQSVTPFKVLGNSYTLNIPLEDLYTRITISEGTSTYNLIVYRIDALTTLPPAPTGFSVGSLETGARLKVTTFSDKRDAYKSYNFYASRETGGTLTGYTLLNSIPVSNPKTSESDNTFYSQKLLSLPDSTHSSIPDILTVKLSGVSSGNTLTLTEDSFKKPDASNTLQATVSFSTTLYTQEYVFDHTRTSSFPDVPDTSPLYYVASLISYDPVTKRELESPFSIELSSYPVRLGSQIVSLPKPTRQNILEDIAKIIYSAKPDISIQPGSVLRDLTLDPISFELERLRFIIDFFYRATSFSTLLAVDNDDTYLEALRQALYLSTTEKAKIYFDQAFDKLASNLGQVRSEGTKARGQVVFYTTSTPKESLFVPAGTEVSSGTLSFVTLENSIIDINRLFSYLDPISGRYAIRVLVEAVDPGVAGNLGPSQVKTIVSSVRGLNVTNEASFFGGTDGETNRQLYERCSRVLASVDSGTSQGYKQLLAGTAGVLDSYVAGPGNRFMFRDYSELLDKNLAGKIDLWVQGYNEVQVSESFSVDALVLYNEPFEIYDLQNLKFRLKDTSRVDQVVKILNVIRDNGTPVLGFKRGDTNEYFTLVDSSNVAYTLESGILTLPKTDRNNSLVLNNLTFSTPLLADIQLTTPRSYSFKKYQPVKSIDLVQVESENGDLIDLPEYFLSVQDSPYLLGGSVKSTSEISIPFTTDNDAILDKILSQEEEIVITNIKLPEYFSKYGVYTDSVEVFEDSSRMVPLPKASYSIISGSETSLTGIQLSSNPVYTTGFSGSTSTIQPGDTIYIRYKYRPNITVNYTTNLLVSATQAAVDAKKHLAADVLVKEAIAVPIDISAVVSLNKGASISAVDANIRTNLSNHFSKLKLGDPVRQSDIIEIIDSTEGVSYVQVPLLQMARTDFSPVMYEPVSLRQNKFVDITNSLPLSGSGYLVWRSDSLYHNAVNTKETENYYTSILLDRKELELVYGIVLTAPNLTYPEFTGPYQAAILYNKVYITTPIEGINPINHEIYANYVALYDEGPKNIEPEDIEYAVLGEVLLKFGEDTR